MCQAFPQNYEGGPCLVMTKGKAELDPQLVRIPIGIKQTSSSCLSCLSQSRFSRLINLFFFVMVSSDPFYLASASKSNIVDNKC